MDDFEKELKVGFLQEAQQIIADTEQCFLELESNPSDKSILEKIFRLAHNLKGSSKAVGFDAMGAFTHEFESFLLQIKNGSVPCSTEAVNLLLRTNDQLKTMIEGLLQDLGATFDTQALHDELKQGQQGVFKATTSQAESQDTGASIAAPTPETEVNIPAVAEGQEAFFSEDDVKALQEAQQAAIAAFQAAAAEPLTAVESPANAAAAAPVVEKSPATLAGGPQSPATLAGGPQSPATLAGGQQSPATLAGGQQSPATLAGGQQPSAHQGGQQPDESIRVSLARLEKLLNFVGEIVILQTMLREQTATLNHQSVKKTISQMGKVTKEVQDLSMSLRMIPLKQTFQKMQRIVRDTSQMLGKKVNLTLAGEETELDKTVLENLSDPLVHIIRNAVDHGIEPAALRLERGKPEAGTVRLSAYHQSGKLVIEIEDDGGGIPGQVLLKKAIEKGILKPGTVLPDSEAVKLVFHPGFSTKSEISEVSGRGVGMDVVKTNIEKMSGEVQIQTELGKGTTFKILLPLTLSIIDGMVLKCEKDRYIIPLAHVHESFRPKREEIHFNSGLGEVLYVRGENLPMYRLQRLLGVASDPKRDPMQGIAIIVRASKRPFAVFVDDILGQSQIVIKRLGSELSSIVGYSGSAILGDGKPALILELPDLAARAKPLTQPVLKPMETDLTQKRSA